MSHSSGIPVSPQLKAAFAAAQSDPAVRALQVVIGDAELIAKESVPAGQPSGQDWEQDLSLVPALLAADEPCYVLFKKGGAPGEAVSWVFFCYVPDTAKVKPKMLYASTRAPCKIQLGSSSFDDDIYGTEPSDFTKEGYFKYIESKKAEAPLTDAEFTKQQELESGEIHMGGGSTHVHGVAFPIDDDVITAVKGLDAGHNYVQIAIDTEKERITLDHTGTVEDISALKKEINAKEPRFHIYAWSHDFKGSNVNSVVFVFSCPDGSAGTSPAPVKQRMLYSSSKANVGSIVESVGRKIDGKVEVNSADELSDENVLQAVHPAEIEEKKAFARPQRAGRPGGRRLIRDKQ